MATKLVREMEDWQLRARWRRHLIKSAGEVWNLLDNRAKFREVARMLEENPAVPRSARSVHRWIYRLWGSEALMGVRRELDDQHGVINLRHTLYEMEARPASLSRLSYLDERDLTPNDFRGRKAANRAFDALGIVIAGPTYSPDPHNDYIDPKVITFDRKALEQGAHAAFRYAQLLVAHRTPVENREITYAEIDQAIDTIARTLNKYYDIVNGEPLNKKWGKLPRGWSKAFEVPWHVKRNRNPRKR